MDKYYPLIAWHFAAWLVPFVVGIAVLIAVFLSDNDTIGTLIGAAASVVVAFVGAGGFCLHLYRRHSRRKSVVAIKDWWSNVGAAPILMCDKTTKAAHSRISSITRYVMSDRDYGYGGDDDEENVFTRFVLSPAILNLLHGSNITVGQCCKPYTFITLHDDGPIKRSGRLFAGVALGRYVDVFIKKKNDDGDLVYMSADEVERLIAHELQHVLLNTLLPGSDEETQHSIMSEN